MGDPYKIRSMTWQEVNDIAVVWAKIEEWNPGVHDAICFFAEDKKGFFVGELDGKPVSCISAVRYNDKFGFIGFYIVAKKHRGKGYGLKLFKHALRYLGERNIGADGVLERVEDYKTMGFMPYYKNRRYLGKGFKKKTISENIKDIKDVNFNLLASYDDSIFPAKRHKFLKCWITQPLSRGFVYLKGKTMGGYGVIRKCFEGFKIGPLFADNEEIAEELFLALTGSAGKNKSVYFDIPEKNPQAIRLAKKYRMKKVFETARIYTKGEPEVPIKKVFGVTSFELG